MIEEVTTERLQILTYQSPKKGKSCCGDSFVIISDLDYTVIALADGLGSGERAKESSAAVMDVIHQYHHEELYTLLLRCNNSLKLRRGAAVAIVKIYYAAKEIVFAGVGNIKFITISPSGKTTYPLPKAGFLSGKPVTFPIQRFSYVPNSLFAMNSDGAVLIPSRNLLNYQDSLNELLENVDKQNAYEDDATMLVGRIKQ